MTVNQKIENALKGIIPKIWPDVCPLDKQPDKYIVYNSEADRAEGWADDEELAWIHHMQIHFFTKANPLQDRKKIRKALKEAGFLVTDIIPLYESDTGYRHLTFEAQIEEEE